jgi:hypothetical protein
MLSSNGGGGNKGGATIKKEGGKGRRQSRQQQLRQEFRKPAVKQPRFEGRCKGLEGFIYGCFDGRQADQFTKTTKEIAEYAGRTLKHGTDICKAIKNLELPILAEPDDPGENAGRVQQRIFDESITNYIRQVSILHQNLNKMYSIVLG